MIKNSVYVLPYDDETQEDSQWVLREIVKGGGDGSLVEVAAIDFFGAPGREIAEGLVSGLEARMKPNVEASQPPRAAVARDEYQGRIPFLHGGVVDKFHWLNERQFLDAVAVAMITPGPVVIPVVITVAFVGFLVAGLLGAAAAAVGVFLPCYSS